MARTSEALTAWNRREPSFTERDMRKYQREFANFILEQQRCAGWIQMRFGKTVSTLTAINELLMFGAIRRVLVVVPNFVATECVWPIEAMKWEHLAHLNVGTVRNTHAVRTDDVVASVQRCEITVISYYNLVWLIGSLKHDWPFDMVVFDEASHFKSPSTKRFKAAAHILDANPNVRVVELTGTPTSSAGLLNVWAQIYLLDGGRRLGRRFDQFQRRFFFPTDYNEYNWQPFEDTRTRLPELISDLVYQPDPADYVAMPPLVRSKSRIALPPKLRSVYNELEREFLLEYEDAPDIEAETEASLTNKLLQFCDGAVYDEEHQAREFHELKLDALEDFMVECGGRALIAYNYNFSWPMIQRRFPNAVHVREPNAVQRWCDGTIDELVCHPKMVAYGLDLWPGGHVFCHFGNNWSLETTQQFEARLNHPSQPPITAHRIVVADSRDEDVIAGFESGAATQAELFAEIDRATRARQ